MMKPTAINLTVTGLAYKGQGIAHHLGKVFFIDDVLPGDQILVEDYLDHGSWAEASESTLVSPASIRQPSPCAYSDTCGGCQWLELPYAEQQRWKAGFINDAMQRVGKLSACTVDELRPSPLQLHYRNRIMLRGQLSADGSITLGYFRKKSRDLVPISRCMIATPLLNQVLERLLEQRLLTERAVKFRLNLQVVELFAEGQQASVLATVHPVEAGTATILQGLVSVLQGFAEVLWSGLHEELKTLRLIPFEGGGDNQAPFYTAPEQFQQVNLGQNRAVRHLLSQLVDNVAPRGTVVDLFCGTGNLSLGLAQAGRRIFGVELNAQAIKIANFMVAGRGLTNAQYFHMSADSFLEAWGRHRAPPLKKRRHSPQSLPAEAQGLIEVLIADPPRAGMKECLPHLLRLRPRKIIYLSCDPITMARDIGKLGEAYEVELLRGFDFFPQTYHVETLAVLTLRHP